jgi:putative toxin-antitoxin system antitoxin component (TIGR02293 family)
MLQISSSVDLVDRILGTKLETASELIDAVRAGLPVTTIDTLVGAHRITTAEVDRVIVPRKTLANRKRIGTLTPEQSDRLLRVVRIIALAEETFRSKEKASTWLRRKTTALNDQAPLNMLDTNEGAHQVEVLLGRIRHGLAA